MRRILTFSKSNRNRTNPVYYREEFIVPKINCTKSVNDKYHECTLEIPENKTKSKKVSLLNIDVKDTIMTTKSSNKHIFTQFIFPKKARCTLTEKRDQTMEIMCLGM